MFKDILVLPAYPNFMHSKDWIATVAGMLKFRRVEVNVSLSKE